MIPILFDETEEKFTSNGIGRLSEALECTVTEELNGQYELEMRIPTYAKHFEEISNAKLILAKPNAISEKQIFEIYDITTPMGGEVTISARHESYKLSDIPCRPFSASSAAQALQGFSDNAMEECPFVFWTDKETAANYKQDVPASIRERLGGVEGSILDCYGGEYEFDGKTVKLWSHRGKDRGVTIRYGKNLTDAKQEQSIASTYTGVVGYWHNEENGTVYTDPIRSDNAGNFAYKKTKVIDFSGEFQEKPTQEELAQKVRTYIKSNGIGTPNVSVDVSFVDLADTEEYKNLSRELIGLGDTVTVIFEKIGIKSKAKVTKTVYDVLTERYTSITLGTYYTLESTINGISSNIEKAQKKASSDLEKAKQSVTEQITGANGGYVRLNYDAGGNPYEILVMDQPDIERAKKVWRWNKNGLGYSSTGYGGEYGIAMTQDGQIVADFITTGRMSANLVKAGILTDGTGLNYWNLETGEFQLTPKAKVGESTIASADDVTTAAAGAEKNAIDAATEKVQKLDESLSQKEVFNRLTNNGTAKGIYLQDQDLFINASYIKAGELEASLIKSGKIASSDNSLVFDLDEKKLTAHKLDIMTDYFTLNEAGASISGTISSGTDAGKKTVIKDGVITGYKEGKEQASLDIGDGLFNVLGNLAINGVVGISGSFLAYENAMAESAQMVNSVSGLNGTASVVTSVSGGSVALSGGGVTASTSTVMSSNGSFSTATTVVTNVFYTQPAVIYSRPTATAGSISFLNGIATITKNISWYGTGHSGLYSYKYGLLMKKV